MLKPQSWGLTVLLGALAGMTALAVDMSLPSLPTITASFNASPQSVQLTLSLFLVGYAGAQLFCGPLSDRLGRRRVLIGGLAIYTLAGYACAISPSIEVLVTARLIQGCGACVGPVLGRALVNGFVFAGLFSFLSGSPFVLIDIYGVPVGQFGFYFALSAVGLIIGAFLNGRLAHRFASEQVMRGGFALLLSAAVVVLGIA